MLTTAATGADASAATPAQLEARVLQSHALFTAAADAHAALAADHAAFLRHVLERLAAGTPLVRRPPAPLWSATPPRGSTRCQMPA